jgi:hypothetical protein
VYVGKKPCDLPCNGIAVRRGYRFLLPSSPKLNIGASFSFEFPQGSVIDLSEEVRIMLQKVAGDNDSFAERINSLIAEKTGRSDWLKFEHSPSESSFMATWWIEYFECLQFELEVHWSIREIIREPDIYTISVTPTASTYVVKDMKETYLDVTIPAFDGYKIDKCNPLTLPKSLCAKEINLALKISHQVEGLMANLKVEPSGIDKPVAYLWEAQDGNPQMSNGQEASFTFTQSEHATRLIQLTAFTERGCRVIVKDTIDLNPQQ